MREMKDSGVEWIGKIPKDWEIVPLEWTGCLNNIRACAREIVEKEIIFA